MSKDDENRDIEREERAIYVIVIVASAPVVIGLLIHRGVIDGGATLSIMLVLLGLAGLLGGFVAALRSTWKRRLPRATLRRRR